MLRMHFVWEQQGKSQSGSAASRAFFANRNILCNKAASFRKRWFFFKIVTPGACFAAGHKKVYKTDLDTMNVHFRRLLRFGVGPRSHTNWLSPHRNAIPVRVKATVRVGHGKLLPPNINVPSTTVEKFSHENSMSHNWPLETMMSGKFPAQKILFDHPRVSLGDQFACEVVHNNSPATFGRDAIHS